MTKIRDILIWLYSIPINYKIFPKEIAKKLPLRVHYRVKCVGLYKNCIEIHNENIYKGMIQIGLPKPADSHYDGNKSTLSFETDNSKIIFLGRADFLESVKLRVYEKGVLTIGDGFFSNSNVSINCSKAITIGSMAQLGWDVEMIDTDGHDILTLDGEKINPDKEIVIGDNVWIGARTSILKGTVIPNDCVIGYGSIVSKKLDEANAIYAGISAKKIKNGICWNREKTS